MTGAGLEIRKVNSRVKTKPKDTEPVEPLRHQSEVSTEQPGSEKGQDGGISEAQALSVILRVMRP